jgi:hypothetical protein
MLKERKNEEKEERNEGDVCLSKIFSFLFRDEKKKKKK